MNVVAAGSGSVNDTLRRPATVAVAVCMVVTRPPDYVPRAASPSFIYVDGLFKPGNYSAPRVMVVCRQARREAVRKNNNVQAVLRQEKHKQLQDTFD